MRKTHFSLSMDTQYAILGLHNNLPIKFHYLNYFSGGFYEESCV